MAENIISPLSLINHTMLGEPSEETENAGMREGNQIVVSSLSELDMLSLGSGEMRQDVLATADSMEGAAQLWSADDFFEQERNGNMDSNSTSLPISVSVIPNEIPNEIPNVTDMSVGSGVEVPDSLLQTTDADLEVETPGFQSLEFDSPEQDTSSMVASESLLNDEAANQEVCRVIKLNTNDTQIRTLLDQGAIIIADPPGDGTAILVPPSSVGNPQVRVENSDAMVEVVNTDNN